jgi:hypothetical protein
MQDLEQILETMEHANAVNPDTDVSSRKDLQALVQSMRVAVQERVFHHLLNLSTSWRYSYAFRPEGK